MILYIAAFIALGDNVISPSPGVQAAAGRISAVEVWKNNSNEDTVNVAHAVNCWPALLEQLTEPIVVRSAIIEGDVMMYKQRKHRNRAIPLMSAPSKVADRITFKEWLREVSKLRKVIKINVRSTEAIRPVLQYLFAASSEIASPVILHANVFRSPRSTEAVVDAEELLDGAKKFFPEATLSIGWTRNNASLLPLTQRRISWRDLFEVLSLVKDLEQSIMISVRLTVAANSARVLSFLLGMRTSMSVLVWSDEWDEVEDWTRLNALRSGPHSKRLVFDLHPTHRDAFRQLYFSVPFKEAEYVRSEWRRVEFPSASLMSSGAVESTDGVAFLGWPTSFLISLRPPPVYPKEQSIAANLLFARKRHAQAGEWLNSCGFAVYLLEKVLDVQSPEIDTGIKVFVGYNGKMSIENRDRHEMHYQSKSVGQLRKESCYTVEIVDRGWRVELTAWIRDCISDQVSSRSEISLETPLTRSRQLRTVIVSKTGDAEVDLLVLGLKHSSAVPVRLSFLSLALVIPLLWRFLFP